MGLNIKPKINLEVDEDLRLKQQVTQVSPQAVSEIIFNTGNVNRDKDLNLMFKQLQKAKQEMFEDKGGKGSVKNLFVTILNRTKDITDHKILPDEAVALMFEIGTTVTMEHTLVKDGKLSKEEMGMKAKERSLKQQMDASEGILAELTKKVRTNNEQTDPLLDGLISNKTGSSGSSGSSGAVSDSSLDSMFSDLDDLLL